VREWYLTIYPLGKILMYEVIAVLGPLGELTDALSAEKNITISVVLGDSIDTCDSIDGLLQYR